MIRQLGKKLLLRYLMLTLTGGPAASMFDGFALAFKSGASVADTPVAEGPAPDAWRGLLTPAAMYQECRPGANL